MAGGVCGLGADVCCARGASTGWRWFGLYGGGGESGGEGRVGEDGEGDEAFQDHHCGGVSTDNFMLCGVLDCVNWFDGAIGAERYIDGFASQSERKLREVWKLCSFPYIAFCP